MEYLRIEDLHVTVENKEILKGVNLVINEGEVVALFGPNGHGKSTLFLTIMGHPNYTITQGKIYFKGIDITKMSTNERSKLGLFLGMQTPVEVPGVVNSDFLRAAVNARRDKPISTYEFYKRLDAAVKEVKMSFDLATRGLNEGFSGGEKKRNEILQMVLLDPEFIMLDEIDSGLDIDAITIIADCIHRQAEKGKTLFVISHYARLFDQIKPTRAVVMIDGRIVLDGGEELVTKIDNEGYEFLSTDYGIDIEKNGEDAPMNTVSIGACAVKENAGE
ncbi:MAG: Fe-S cluster assembly ATPase SufC [Coprobacillus sp.]|nr:Fe-S cluster assembly ATPase SufC [Coprobacillus sp.]